MTSTLNLAEVRPEVACEYPDLGLGQRLIGYEQAWELQRSLHSEIADQQRNPTVLLLEHADVYTAGKRTEVSERPADGTPVIDVDRGGKITWHGPGQLVGYPIITLPDQVRVVDFVRRLEEALIRTAADFGVTAGRIGGWSGAWLPGLGGKPHRKLAAIGIRVSRQTTMHGFAINVCPDLRAFDRIVACGLTGVEMTSLSAELGRHLEVAEVAQAIQPHLDELLSFQPYHSSPDVAEAQPSSGPSRR